MSRAAKTTRPTDFGPLRPGDAIGMSRDGAERTRDAGLIPSPDNDGRRWSTAVVVSMGRVRSSVAGPEALCDLVVGDLLADRQRDDDVALLALHLPQV